MQFWDTHLQKDKSRIRSDCWELKELVSRDGQAKLKANVFFASFDQRSEKADGHSTCSIGYSHCPLASIKPKLHANGITI